MTYRLNWPLNVEQVSGRKKKKKQSGAGSAPAITSRGGQGM